MCPTPNQTNIQQNSKVSAMESRDESKIGLVEKAAEAEFTEDKLPWLSVDNGTLVSTAVKLMVSIVVSSSVSTIVFILKKQRSYAEDIMSHIYVSVIMLWVSLMCLIFCRFMLSGMLKGKSQQIKTCFLLGMGMKYFFVFTGVLYASLSWGENEELLFGMLFIGVFNSMVMLMFHETKTKKEEENRQTTYYTHNTFDIPKVVLVEKLQEK